MSLSRTHAEEPFGRSGRKTRYHASPARRFAPSTSIGENEPTGFRVSSEKVASALFGCSHTGITRFAGIASTSTSSGRSGGLSFATSELGGELGTEIGSSVATTPAEPDVQAARSMHAATASRPLRVIERASQP